MEYGEESEVNAVWDGPKLLHIITFDTDKENNRRYGGKNKRKNWKQVKYMPKTPITTFALLLLNCNKERTS